MGDGASIAEGALARSGTDTTMRPSVRPLIVLVVVQPAIFVVSLPGFGLETRKPTDYAAWAGPIFLLLTILVFLTGAAAVILAGSRGGASIRLGALQGVIAIGINLLDFSHVGGPPPPTGPLLLGVIAIAVGVLELLFADRARRLTRLS